MPIHYRNCFNFRLIKLCLATLFFPHGNTEPLAYISNTLRVQNTGHEQNTFNNLANCGKSFKLIRFVADRVASQNYKLTKTFTVKLFKNSIIDSMRKDGEEIHDEEKRQCVTIQMVFHLSMNFNRINFTSMIA